MCFESISWDQVSFLVSCLLGHYNCSVWMLHRLQREETLSLSLDRGSLFGLLTHSFWDAHTCTHTHLESNLGHLLRALGVTGRKAFGGSSLWPSSSPICGNLQVWLIHLCWSICSWRLDDAGCHKECWLHLWGAVWGCGCFLPEQVSPFVFRRCVVRGSSMW